MKIFGILVNFQGGKVSVFVFNIDIDIFIFVGCFLWGCLLVRIGRVGRGGVLGGDGCLRDVFGGVTVVDGVMQLGYIFVGRGGVVGVLNVFVFQEIRIRFVVVFIFEDTYSFLCFCCRYGFRGEEDVKGRQFSVFIGVVVKESIFS